MLKFLLYAVVALILLVIIVIAIGYALPQSHVASVEAVLAASPARVFERISDPTKYPAWRKDLTRVDILATQPLKWREHGNDDPITFEVVESRPPDRHVVRIADPDLPFGGTWTYELKADGEATRLVITERGEVYNPMFRFIGRFFMSPTATMERYIEALRTSF